MAVKFTPTPEGLNAEFYAACAKGKLYFQRCDACATWRHPPRTLCATCGSWKWSWQPSNGRGRVYTWTVTHQPLHPAFTDETPYAVIVVELEEGVRLVSGLRDCAPSELKLDLAVVVEIEKVSDTMALPFFRRM